MSDPLWTCTEITEATSGRLIGDPDSTIDGISIDSRSARSGDLFVALNVARDGHEFVDAALKAGAAASLVSRTDVPGTKIVVNDTSKALEALGVVARERCSATRFAITGSVGKTSAKDALASILATDAPTHSSIKSYNNQWGVPLTLARMPKSTRWGVFEIGTSNPGEIAPLSKLVKPHVALITRIAEAHLEGFGSIEAIAREKASIWAALDLDGVAVLPFAGTGVATLRAQIKNFGVRNVLTFGVDEASDVRIIDWQTNPDGSTGCFDIAGEVVRISAKVTGMHWGEILAAVMAAAIACGESPKEIAEKMQLISAGKGRGAWIKLPLDQGYATLIDDSYNANPTSMKAALDTLSRFSNGRKLAVLGDMLELGTQGPLLHAQLSWPIQNANVEKVWCVGELMGCLYEHLPKSRRAPVEKDIAGLVNSIYSQLQDGDVLLVKGSNGSEVHRVVTELKKMAHSREN